MSSVTMIDRGTPPTVSQAKRALHAVSQAAGTPEPGAWAFYLGGPEHNHGNGSLYKNSLLDDLEALGVALLPIYVGLQENLSHKRGVQDAEAAMQLNDGFRNRNTIVVADIERRGSDPDIHAAVRYVDGWTETLHAGGLRAMAYCPFNLAALLGRDGDPKPDAIWVSRFRSDSADPSRRAEQIPGVDDDTFVGQRAWQYCGDITLDKPSGGINVDISIIHKAVLSGSPAGVKVAQPHPHPTGKRAPAGLPRIPKQRVHVVQPQDTVFGLETELNLEHGSLFAANKDVIEAAAKAHGHTDSEHGALIFPGTTLVIPKA